MHSRKKRIQPPSAEEIAAEKNRLEKIHKLHKMVFEEIATGLTREEGLALSEKAMMISPDIYTFMNFRRKLVLWKMSLAEDEEQKVKIFAQELELLTRIIKESPKSYTLWYHRQWVIRLAANVAQILSRELALCDLMLKKDNRNFHVWNYRSWVVELEGQQSVNEELEFTKTMICRDFSNFSAWHYRTKVVRKKFLDDVPTEFVRGELDMLKNAYFTCPNDQSVWNYHRWLLQSSETIKIVAVKPREYLQIPDYFLIGFSHCVSQVDSESIAVSLGFEALDGTWEPVHTKPFSYIWKFTPTSKSDGPVEIRLNPINTKLIDFNGKKRLAAIKYLFHQNGNKFEFKAEGLEDVEILQGELANIDELLQIEEDDVVQVLLRKAQICEELYYSIPGSNYIDVIIQCYQELIRKEPKHLKFYNETLSSFLAIKSGSMPNNIQRYGKIEAKLLGIE
jgi:hypothetical protein